jgi:hypothetical protein
MNNDTFQDGDMNKKRTKRKNQNEAAKTDKKVPKGNQEQNTTKSIYDMTMDKLIAIKDDYTLTRDLTPSQIREKLNAADLRFLMIDWNYPAYSIREVTMGERKDTTGSSPPPSIFAKTLNYKENMKGIGQFWRLTNVEKINKIKAYHSLSLQEKQQYTRNMLELVRIQQELFDSRFKVDNQSQDLSANTNNKRTFNDVRRVSLEGGNNEANSSRGLVEQRTSPPSSYRPRFRTRLFSPVQQVFARLRSPARDNRADPLSTRASASDQNGDDSASSTFQRLASERQIDEETNIASSSSHADGIFTQAVTLDGENEAQTKKDKNLNHIAGKKVMDKIKAVLNAMAAFVSFTQILFSSKSDLCNDLLLVYARNVELTSTKSGHQLHKKLDRIKITFIGRNHDHCSRILRHMLKGIRGTIYQDEKFVDEYETEFVYIDNKNNAMKEFIDRLDRERPNNDE